MELSTMKGLGPVRLKALRAVGIDSLRDLLFFLPSDYEDHSQLSDCSVSCAGPVTVRGKVQKDATVSWFHGLSRVSATLFDETGHLTLVWFNQPWMKDKLHAGNEITVSGRLAVKDGRRSLQNPRLLTELGIQPLYKTIESISPKLLRDLISQAMEQVRTLCPETLSERIRREYRLCDLPAAIRISHFPENKAELAVARHRLAFEQMLLSQAYLTHSRNDRMAGFPFAFPAKAADDWWNTLHFPPTGAQRRVLEEIAGDLSQPFSMSRLVQGDVGCGKTAVAFGAIYLSFRSGFQAAMMAPTEILAAQHYTSARQQLEPLGIRCRLLTGSTKASERREVLHALNTGECDAVFGTHALISEGVDYAHLGLVITDEQHRFGVRQRSRLAEKGNRANASPHVLVMSATPIPRTLALILYGDLDISVIDELPAGRKPVQTRLVPEEKREAMYGFLRSQVQNGSQAYVVCPLVEESEEADDLRSAASTFHELKNGMLSGLRVGLTWGGQKSDEKQQTLEAFAEGKLDVLVSTTVIEVGVNVPNASVMVVENAARFGLSQLHQLRGRVGRGSRESWCFLVASQTEKLGIMASSNDGFVIAQKDLELRGPGDLMGTRQSGESTVGLLLDGDLKTLEDATRCLRELRGDPARKDELSGIEAEAMRKFGENYRIALN